MKELKDNMDDLNVRCLGKEIIELFLAGKVDNKDMQKNWKNSKWDFKSKNYMRWVLWKNILENI